MQPIAVYDTNILFSGTGWNGTPYHCLELVRQDRVEGVTCIEILDELAEKFSTTSGSVAPRRCTRIKHLMSLRMVTLEP